MNTLNEKLALLQAKIKQEKPVTIMIMGLGSVGLYLFDLSGKFGRSGFTSCGDRKKPGKIADGCKYCQDGCGDPGMSEK